MNKFLTVHYMHAIRFGAAHKDARQRAVIAACRMFETTRGQARKVFDAGFIPLLKTGPLEPQS